MLTLQQCTISSSTITQITDLISVSLTDASTLSLHDKTKTTITTLRMHRLLLSQQLQGHATYTVQQLNRSDMSDMTTPTYCQILQLQRTRAYTSSSSTKYTLQQHQKHNRLSNTCVNMRQVPRHLPTLRQFLPDLQLATYVIFNSTILHASSCPQWHSPKCD